MNYYWHFTEPFEIFREGFCYVLPSVFGNFPHQCEHELLNPHPTPIPHSFTINVLVLSSLSYLWPFFLFFFLSLPLSFFLFIFPYIFLFLSLSIAPDLIPHIYICRVLLSFSNHGMAWSWVLAAYLTGNLSTLGLWNKYVLTTEIEGQIKEKIVIFDIVLYFYHKDAQSTLMESITKAFPLSALLFLLYLFSIPLSQLLYILLLFFFKALGAWAYHTIPCSLDRWFWNFKSQQRLQGSVQQCPWSLYGWHSLFSKVRM